MAVPAAMLAVAVQAQGIQQTASQLRSLHGDFDKAGANAVRAGDDIERTGKRGSMAMKGLKLAGGVLAGVAGFEALKSGIGKAVDEYQEAQKVGANTEQVIKATGGAANVSAGHVANLAGAISKKAGIDDEAIQSGSNLLLTFKNVRNEAGKNADIFDQATQAAVDLSAAGFGSIESTSKQMGKALNDPVKGITALGRAGVTFSDDQKKAIKALVDTGKASDRVKAQQMILREVQSQVGGQAAAQATDLDKAKVALGNLAEAAGAVLVPAISKGARFLTDLVNQMVEGRGVGGALVSTFRDVGGGLGALVGTISALVGWFKQHSDATAALLAITGTLAAAYLASLVPAIALSTAMLISNAAAWTAAKVAMLASPMGLIVAGLTAVVVAIVLAIKHWDDIRATLGAVWGWIQGTVGGVFGAVVSAITGAWSAVKGATESVWNGIKAALSGVWNAIKDAASAVFSAIKTAITTYVHGWLAVITGIDGAFRAAGTALFSAVRDGISAVAGAISSAARAVVVAGLTAVQSLVDNFRNAGSSLVHAIISGISAVAGVVGNLRDLVSGGLAAVKSFADNFVQAGKDLVQGLINGIKSLAGAALKAAENLVGDAIDAAKKKLHIGSPSRVFHGIGSDLSKGFALGISSGAGGALAALHNDLLAPVMGAAAGASVNVGASGGVIATGGSPLMHVENMHVYGEQDFDSSLRRLAWAVETS